MKARAMLAALVAVLLTWFGREVWLRLAAAPVGDFEARAPVSETIDVQGPIQLEFDGLDGTLIVRPGAPGRVEITAHKIAYGASPEEATAHARELPLAIQREGERVSFSARQDDVLPWQAGRALRVDYQIIAPEQSGLKVSDAKGSVQASGLHRGVDLTGGDVVVRLSNVRGGASVAVERGNVVVDGADGPTVLRTAAGDINAMHVSGPDAELDAGGSVSVAESQVTGRLLATAKGKSVALRRTHAATIDVKADNGSVELSDASADEELQVKGGVGAITVERTQAHPLSVETVRAGIELKEVQGEVAVTTAGEPVTLFGASPSSLSVSSGGGDVYFTGSLPTAGATAIDTGGGVLRMSVAKETACDLDADAGGGELAVDSRLLAGTELGESAARMAINGGGAKVVLRTHGGALRLAIR